MRKYFIIALMLSLIASASIAQKYPYPMDYEIRISASFAEMRDNHFHMGLDMATMGREGIPVHSVDDGYVSRIVVSPYGYGRCILVNHPDGHTTLYGHLSGYPENISKVVTKAQTEAQDYSIDISFQPDEIPVKKWDVIGLSGNTGGSQAPHLHFEVRETESQKALNPLQYLVDIPDNVKPEVSGIMVYGMNDSAQVSYLCQDKYYPLYQIQNHRIPVYGQIGLGADVIDRFIPGGNRCGVVNTKLYDGDKLIFESNIDTISFDDTRYINSYFDYKDRRRNSRYIQKSFVDTYNHLRNVYKECRSIITVGEGESHNMRYEFLDHKGNQTIIKFTLTGQKSATATPRTHTGYLVRPDADWNLEAHGFGVSIPKLSLYRNEYIPVITDSIQNTISVGTPEIPVHSAISIRMGLTEEQKAHKDKVFAKHTNAKGYSQFVSSQIVGDSILIKPRIMGAFSLDIDTIPPTGVSRNTGIYLRAANMISVRPSDDKTSITDYDAYIDNVWKPFEYDYKNNRIMAWVKDLDLLPGKHQLVLKLYDAVGNEGTFTWDFWVR